MAIVRTRKNKKNPHYGFLVSWAPKGSNSRLVKGESKSTKISMSASNTHNKNAVSLAQAEANDSAKKGILRSLIRISLILILELVVYLAWNKFIAK